MPYKTINELNEKDYEMVEAMGGTGFSPGEVAEVLEVFNDDFIKGFSDHSSELYRRYRKGLLLAKLQVRRRIFKDAGFGSSPAQTLANKILESCEYKLDCHE